jgi:hypothetical protein
MNKYIIEHGNKTLDLNNIVFNKTYRDFRSICNIFGLPYSKYKKGSSRYMLLKKINLHLNYNKGTNISYDYTFISFKNNNPRLVQDVIYSFNKLLYGKEVLEYVLKYRYPFKEFGFIDFIDSEYVSPDSYLSIQYYKDKAGCNKLKDRLYSTINRANEYFVENEVDKEIIRYVIENINMSVKTQYVIVGLEGVEHKKVDTNNLPQNIMIDSDIYSIKDYIMSKDYSINKFKNKNSKYVDKNMLKDNYDKHKSKKMHNDSSNNSNIVKDAINLLYKYCKHIQYNYPQNYYVYKYTNKLSGLVYIGITNNLYIRQKSRINNPETPFDYTLRAIGLHNFDFSVIDYANTSERVLELERHYIDKYDSLKCGYNMTS